MTPYRKPAFVPPAEESAPPNPRPSRALRRAIGIVLAVAAMPTCNLGLEHHTRAWLLGPLFGLVGLVLIANNNITRDAPATPTPSHDDARALDAHRPLVALGTIGWSVALLSLFGLIAWVPHLGSRGTPLVIAYVWILFAVKVVCRVRARRRRTSERQITVGDRVGERSIEGDGQGATGRVRIHASVLVADAATHEDSGVVGVGDGEIDRDAGVLVRDAGR